MPRQNKHLHHLHQRHIDLNQQLDARPAELEVAIRERDVATVVSVVYVTAAKTFTGPIAGYSTIGPAVGDPYTPATSAVSAASGTPIFTSTSAQSPSPTPVQASTQSLQQQQQQQQQSLNTPMQASTPVTTQTASSSATIATSAPSSQVPTIAISTLPSSPTAVASFSQSSSSALVQSVSSEADPSSQMLSSSSPTLSLQSSSGLLSTSPFVSSIPSSSSPVVSASGASSSKSTTGVSHSSNNLSGGAKAGIAFGVIFGIAALLGLLFFCLRRRKKSHHEGEDQSEKEKNPFYEERGAFAAGRAASMRSTRTASTAPRLSMRPVTQFMPFGGKAINDNASAPTSTSASAVKTQGTGAFNHNHTRSQADNPSNPFGNHAETVNSISNQNLSNDPANPFGNHAEMLDQAQQGPLDSTSSLPSAQKPASLDIRAPTPEPTANVIRNGTGAAAGVRDVEPTHNHHTNTENQIAPPSLQAPIEPAMPSPAGTEFSMNSLTPSIVASGPPAPNVHRVQMDFNPSMEDELGLQIGSLVRLLHEYDDGWALCIRMDRSQQGVAPRTCLSARPVKPRPAGGPRGPLPRGPPPPGFRSPPQLRPAPPANGPPGSYTRAPRAMSPAPLNGQRSMSPAPLNGQRSMSPAPLKGQRSMSPAPLRVQRSLSPGPYGGGPSPQRPNFVPHNSRRRSNSANEVRERRLSPPGPSPMNPNAGIINRLPPQFQPASPPRQVQPFSSAPARKPVPGQAI